MHEEYKQQYEPTLPSFGETLYYMKTAGQLLVVVDTNCLVWNPQGIEDLLNGLAFAAGSISGRNSSVDSISMRPGDWLCAGCGAHNFASRTACFKCHGPTIVKPVATEQLRHVNDEYPNLLEVSGNGHGVDRVAREFVDTSTSDAIATTRTDTSMNEDDLISLSKMAAFDLAKFLSSYPDQRCNAGNISLLYQRNPNLRTVIGKLNEFCSKFSCLTFLTDNSVQLASSSIYDTEKKLAAWLLHFPKHRCKADVGFISFYLKHPECWRHIGKLKEFCSRPGLPFYWCVDQTGAYVQRFIRPETAAVALAEWLHVQPNHVVKACDIGSFYQVHPECRRVIGKLKDFCFTFAHMFHWQDNPLLDGGAANIKLIKTMAPPPGLAAPLLTPSTFQTETTATIHSRSVSTTAATLAGNAHIFHGENISHVAKEITEWPVRLNPNTVKQQSFAGPIFTTEQHVPAQLRKENSAQRGIIDSTKEYVCAVCWNSKIKPGRVTGRITPRNPKEEWECGVCKQACAAISIYQSTFCANPHSRGEGR